MPPKTPRASVDGLAERIARITRCKPGEVHEARSGRTGGSERDIAYRPATLTLDFGEKLKVVIKDLSPTGARVEYFQRRELPEEVHIFEPRSGLDTRAVVTWQRDGTCGLRFAGR